MISQAFLAEWAIRSSVVISCGALLLAVLRVRDASVRLAALTAMLCGSLALPALTIALPQVPVTVSRTFVAAVSTEPAGDVSIGVKHAAAALTGGFDWWGAALIFYVVVVFALLLRLAIGLAMSLRLLRGSRAAIGPDVRESDRVTTPVTLGILRPAIVLPMDWPDWDSSKLEAVLAHERSHVARRDPLAQLLSAVHRAILWHSPLSWYLHRQMIRVAEDASDDAAVAVVGDRASYAEVLLEFMQRGAHSRAVYGVPMARCGQASDRIERILDGTFLSGGVTWRSVASIAAVGLPLLYLVGALHAQNGALIALNPRTGAIMAISQPTGPRARVPVVIAQRRAVPALPAVPRPATVPSVPAALPSAPGPAYVFGPKDVVIVHVVEDKDLTGSYQIGADGRMSMPRIGEFQASGLTRIQLTDLIVSKLKQYYADPMVYLQLGGTRGKRYTVAGGVLRPGTVSLEHPTTVGEALTGSGVADASMARKVYILRNGEKIESPAEKTLVQDGDIIFVPE